MPSVAAVMVVPKFKATLSQANLGCFWLISVEVCAAKVENVDKPPARPETRIKPRVGSIAKPLEAIPPMKLARVLAIKIPTGNFPGIRLNKNRITDAPPPTSPTSSINCKFIWSRCQNV